MITVKREPFVSNLRKILYYARLGQDDARRGIIPEGALVEIVDAAKQCLMDVEATPKATEEYLP